MRRTTSGALAGMMVAGLMAAPAAVSGAREGRADGTVGSKVSISHSANMEFSGRVRSKAGACKRKRAVRIYMVHSGPDMLAGSGKTNRKGRYNIAHEVGGAGDYYAKALKKESGSTTCKVAKSDTVQV